MSARIIVTGLPFFAEKAAGGLREAGFRATHLARPGKSPRAWGALAAGLVAADLVYMIGSSVAVNSPADLFARTGRRVLMHWVGSDVEAAASLPPAKVSRRLVRSARHWADAPWLADELAPLGIRASHHPLPIKTTIGEVAPLPREFRVLIYLPRAPGPSYDVEGTLAVIRALPEVPFAIAGGFAPEPALANVRPLGYVHDMPAAYRECTVLLRLVRHDGFSHSVIEALSFGRYAVWSYPFPGVVSAANVGEAIAALRSLRERFQAGALGPNEEGAASVTQTYGWCTLLRETRTAINQLLL